MYELIFIFKICASVDNLVDTFEEPVIRIGESLEDNTLPQVLYVSVRDISYKCSKIQMCRFA